MNDRGSYDSETRLHCPASTWLWVDIQGGEIHEIEEISFLAKTKVRACIGASPASKSERRSSARLFDLTNPCQSSGLVSVNQATPVYGVTLDRMSQRAVDGVAPDGEEIASPRKRNKSVGLMKRKFCRIYWI